MPTGHRRQAVWLVKGVNLPAAQLVQPGAPAALNVPAAQATHCAAADKAEAAPNRPATHKVHA